MSLDYLETPEHRKRVIYFDPARPDFTIAFNVLRSSLEPYTVANHVTEAFRRTWPKSLGEAPRFTNIMQASLMALVYARKTLVDMPRMLTDPAFRDTVLARVPDPHVLNFFRNRYDTWGKGMTIESVLNKVTALTLNPHLRRCLGAQQNALDPKHIMESGKVLIVNLGSCDDETRLLLGSLLMTGFEQAAKDRAQHRPHYYLYLDEFQDFCSSDGGDKTIAKILAGSRKFNLHVHLAHQTLGQVKRQVLSALGNVDLKIVFGIDYDDGVSLAPRMFVDYVGRTTWERAAAIMQTLPRRTALMKRKGFPLSKIHTLNMPTLTMPECRIERMISTLERIHGIASGLISGTPSRKPVIGSVALATLRDWEAVGESLHPPDAAWIDSDASQVAFQKTAT